MIKAFSILLTMSAMACAQSSGRKAIDSAAEALGGKDRVVAIQTLSMEPSGVAPKYRAEGGEVRQEDEVSDRRFRPRR